MLVQPMREQHRRTPLEVEEHVVPRGALLAPHGRGVVQPPGRPGGTEQRRGDVLLVPSTDHLRRLFRRFLRAVVVLRVLDLLVVRGIGPVSVQGLATHGEGAQVQRRRSGGIGLLLLLLEQRVVQLDPKPHRVLLHPDLRAHLPERSLVSSRSVVVLEVLQATRVADRVRLPHAHVPPLTAEVRRSQLARPEGPRHVPRLLLLPRERRVVLVDVGHHERGEVVRARQPLPVHDALPVHPPLRIGVRHDLLPPAHDLQDPIPLEQAGDAGGFGTAAGHDVGSHERVGLEDRPLAQAPLPSPEDGGVVRLELILVVLPTSLLAHGLDLFEGGVDVGGRGLLGEHLELGLVVPPVGGVFRIVVVDELEVGIVRVGVGIFGGRRRSVVLVVGGGGGTLPGGGGGGEAAARRGRRDRDRRRGEGDEPPAGLAGEADPRGPSPAGGERRHERPRDGDRRQGEGGGGDPRRHFQVDDNVDVDVDVERRATATVHLIRHSHIVVT
ncbi:hypothetical protein ACHAWF_017936 [Thalassiosira exigua]